MGFSDAADPPLTTAPVNVVVPAALAVIILALIVAAAAWIKSRFCFIWTLNSAL